MKITKEEAAKNHARILSASSRLFRERGLSGVGVDSLMEAAGLTYGSLYSHFGSKDALMAEAVKHAAVDFATKMRGTKTLGSHAARYLSAEHRDAPGEGCIVAAVGGEMPRQSREVRRTFTQCVKDSMERLSAKVNSGSTREREDKALVAASSLLGALMLARAVDDPELSDRIMSVTRARFAKDN